MIGYTVLILQLIRQGEEKIVFWKFPASNYNEDPNNGQSDIFDFYQPFNQRVIMFSW